MKVRSRRNGAGQRGGIVMTVVPVSAAHGGIQRAGKLAYPAAFLPGRLFLRGKNGAAVRRIALLKRNAMATPFEKAFDQFAQLSEEAGRDMSLSHDLYWSFIRYQTMIKREFEVMAKRHNFIELDGEGSVSAVNRQLRQRIGEHLGIRATKYTPSTALAHLWR